MRGTLRVGIFRKGCYMEGSGRGTFRLRLLFHDERQDHSATVDGANGRVAAQGISHPGSGALAGEQTSLVLKRS